MNTETICYRQVTLQSDNPILPTAFTEFDYPYFKFQQGTIVDINIPEFDISHGNIGDLRMTSISPSRTRVQIFNVSCGGNVDLQIDDESNFEIPCPHVFPGDFYIPNEALNIFQNGSAVGI